MGEEEKKATAPAAAAEVEEKAKAKAKDEKKEQEGKAEEGKKDGGGGEGEKKEEGGGEKKAEAAAAQPPPPEEIEMRVFMHCEGCARKVKRILKGFDGVKDVKTDCRTHKVVVKGKKVAEDPMKAVQRVQKKTGRKVELLTPLPPAKPEKKEEEKKEEEKPKEVEKKEEPEVVQVVLNVHMHCDACALQIKKRILRMKGVETAEPNLKGSQVTVKGVFDPEKLAEYVSKRTRKHAVVAKQEQAAAAAAAEEKAGGKEKMADEAGGGNADKKGEKDGGGEAAGGNAKDKKGAGGAAEEGAAPPPKAVEQLTTNEFNQYHYHPSYPAGGYDPWYPSYHPQMFSDENPNACAVM